MTTPIQHADGTKEGKMKAYAQLATLGLSMAGLYAIAPMIMDGPGGIPEWMESLETTGFKLSGVPIVAGASILGVLPYLTAQIRTFTDRVPKMCDIPNIVPFSWIVPVGKTIRGKWVYNDFAGGSPHTLDAGATGSGKSVFAQYCLYMLCRQQPPERLYIDIIDLKKGATFGHWDLLPHVRDVRWDVNGANVALTKARDEMNRRLVEIADIRRRFDKLPDYPHYFVVIDEGSLLTLDDECMDLLQEISAIGRQPRIHIFYATQRPSHKVLPVEIRDQLEARFCFKVNEPGTSEMVLGEKNLKAYEIPKRQAGRCIMQIPSGEFEVQTPYLSDDVVEEWLRNYADLPIDVWGQVLGDFPEEEGLSMVKDNPSPNDTHTAASSTLDMTEFEVDC